MEKLDYQGFTLRPAEESDMPVLYELIRELATYEKILDDLKATPEVLHDSIFVRKVAEVLMAEYNGEPAGYAMYFYNFSSFIGLPGLYLEDIYIRPEFRGKGFGKISLAYLARLAIEKNCWGMEWTVLDWNKPSIDFYEGMGAFNRGGWLIYRLKDEALARLAQSL
ncbi:MAG: GNAT family N-acetyltransferase [Bacteroidota bacterium]